MVFIFHSSKMIYNIEVILEITVLVGLHRGRVKSITVGKLEGNMEIDEL